MRKTNKMWTKIAHLIERFITIFGSCRNRFRSFYDVTSDRDRRCRKLPDSASRAVDTQSSFTHPKFCYGNQLNWSLVVCELVLFLDWIEFSVWTMADAANNGGIPKGMRILVRFWGAVSGLCECCSLTIFDHFNFVFNPKIRIRYSH